MTWRHAVTAHAKVMQPMTATHYNEGGIGAINVSQGGELRRAVDAVYPEGV